MLNVKCEKLSIYVRFEMCIVHFQTSYILGNNQYAVKSEPQAVGSYHMYNFHVLFNTFHNFHNNEYLFFLNISF